MRMLNSRVTVHRWICLLVMVLSFVQPAEVKSKTLLTLPARMMQGVLDNGMRYILMPGETSSHNLEMRLVMRVGSLQETRHQRGCAHYLEHLAFEGTKAFPGRSLVHAFERQGMKYGRDINAFTTFDRTVYRLSLPVTDSRQQHEITRQAILAAAEWLNNITINELQVEKERGVILEELRSYQLPDAFYPLKIGNGLHAKRMPLGSAKDISSVSAKAVQQFYHQWYAPCRATLILAGDMDVLRTKQLIEKALGSQSSGKPRIKPRIEPLHYPRGASWMQLVDTLQKGQKIELIVPHAVQPTRCVNDVVERERTQLLLELLEQRFRSEGLACSAYDNWYLGDKNHFVLSFSSTDKQQLMRAVTAAAAECKRVVKDGFCSAELKHAIAHRLDKIVTEDPQKSATALCDDFIDYAILGDMRLYAQRDAEVVKRLLSQTTSAEESKRMADLMAAMRKNVMMAITTNGQCYITKADVINAWRMGMCQRTGTYRYQGHESATPSCPTPLPLALRATRKAAKGTIVSSTRYTNTNIQDVRLANGVRLLLKPTPEADGQLYMAVIGRGGTADLSQREQRTYHDAAGFVDMGGLSHLSADSVADVMTQDSLSMAVGMGRYWHQILASGPVHRSQTLFNLVYEKIRYPGKDTASFEDMRRSEIKNMGCETVLQRMMRRDVDRAMDALTDSLVSNVRRTDEEMSLKDWQNLNLDTLTAYYKQTYGRTDGMTVIATGRFNVGQTASQLAGVFGSLPPSGKAVAREQPIKLPATAVRAHFTDTDMGNNVVFQQVLPFAYTTSLTHSLQLKLMRDILQDELITVLRESLHLVYSPYVDLYYDGCPQQRAYFRLTIETDKNNLKVIENQVRSILSRLTKRAITSDRLDKLKRSFIVTKQQSLSDRTPVEWKNVLITLVKNQESVGDFDQYEQCLQRITPEDIRKRFAESIDFNKTIKLIKSNEN